MKKYRCECRKAKCEVEREDKFKPEYCTCFCTKEAEWQEVKEEEKVEVEAEELPSWCKVGEVVYYTTGKLYCKIHKVDKKRGLILFNSEYLITDFVSISELAEARLRPFNEKEMRELLGKTIVSQTTERICLVVSSSPSLVYAGGYSYSNEELLNYFTFTNGQPCGVYEHLKNGEWVK